MAVRKPHPSETFSIINHYNKKLIERCLEKKKINAIRWCFGAIVSGESWPWASGGGGGGVGGGAEGCFAFPTGF